MSGSVARARGDGVATGSAVAHVQFPLLTGEPRLYLSIEEILRRVNSAVLFSKGAPATGIRGTKWPEHFEIWSAAEPDLASRAIYHVTDFIAYDDADFLVTAYRTILHRAPDVGGFESYISRLRDGSMTKVGLLAELRFSAEGMERGVPIRGLRFAHAIEQLKRKRGVGRLLRWAHEFVRLDVRAVQAVRSDVRHARETHRIGRHVNQVVHEAGMRIEALERELGQLKAVKATVAEQASELNQLELRMAVQEQEVALQEARLHTYETAAQSALEAAKEASGHALQRERLLSGLYSDFEDRFRGSKELITARVEPYLEEVTAALEKTGDGDVLDIGCGRGEWLELLRDRGIAARGIDLNQDFVADAVARGLQVEGADALEVLPLVKPMSLSVVTSFHVAEHLTFEELVALIDGSFRVLKESGTLILETPNPENLDVATLNFYMDPTHRNPLPPELLRWVVESRGFRDVRIERLYAHRDLTVPALVAAEIPGAESINNLVARTHIAPDYAIIGSKPHAA